MSKSLEVHLVPAFADNYVYLCRDHERRQTFVVDPGEADGVLAKLRSLKWELDYILNTHHHNDHVGGNLKLKSETGALIAGYKGDAHRIPGLDIVVTQEDSKDISGLDVQVLEIFGHTLGHIAYYFPQGAELFCGDTLFASGCGRLFEGTAEQLFMSLRKLAKLPVRTKIYCGHEYSLQNTEFALRYEEHNSALQSKYQRFCKLRQQALPTLPVTLEQELLTNPFLRCAQPEIKKALGLLPETSELLTFTRLREQRNHF